MTIHAVVARGFKQVIFMVQVSLAFFGTVAVTPAQHVTEAGILGTRSVDDVRAMFLQDPATVLDVAVGRRHKRKHSQDLANVLYFLSAWPYPPLTGAPLQDFIDKRLRVAKACLEISWGAKVSNDMKAYIAAGTVRLLRLDRERGHQLLKDSLMSTKGERNHFAFLVLSSTWSAVYFDLLKPFLMDDKQSLHRHAIRAYRKWVLGGVQLNRDSEVMSALSNALKSGSFPREVLFDIESILKKLG